MTQVRPFNISAAGITRYLCLKNVRLGYGIPATYGFAKEAWDNSPTKHQDQTFPAGCAVPVYFDWVGTVDGVRKNWGHIAVRLPDGRIWTDGRYYNSVASLSTNYISGGRYLGWTEDVNNVKVVEGASEVANRDQVNTIYKAVLFRDGDPGGLTNYTGRDANQIVSEMLSSQERKNLEATFAAKDQAISRRDSIIGQLNQTIGDLSSRPTKDELQKAIENVSALTVQLEQANQKVADAEADLAKAREEAQTPDEKAVVESWFKKLWNRLFK